jgi:hypothetical protein
MKSPTKKASAKATVRFKDLKPSKNPKGGGGQPHMIKLDTPLKIG